MDESLRKEFEAAEAAFKANLSNGHGYTADEPRGNFSSEEVENILDPIKTENTGFYDTFKEKPSPNYDDLLERFKRDTHYRVVPEMKDKSIFRFNGTHFEEMSSLEIQGYAESKFKPKPTDRMRKEFFHKVMNNNHERRDFFFISSENRINFKNVVLDITPPISRLIYPVMYAHAPEFGFRYVLPYEFNHLATCPTFDAWILDCMLGDSVLVSILQEFMGYIIAGGEYKYHKALWLSGSGRNGKSTFLSILKALVGHRNYSSLSMGQIASDKFATAQLDGKYVNFSEETSPKELNESATFKNLTGDGEFTAQTKNGPLFVVRNRAKLVMTYNEIPELKDLTPGMLSRPIIIPWEKDLTDDAAQDKELLPKLMAELPGIFNFALAGWIRLENQKRFTESPKSKAAMADVLEAACSVAQWVRDKVTFLPLEDATNPKRWRLRELYEIYKSDLLGQYPYSERRFAMRLALIPEIKERKRHSEKGAEYSRLSLVSKTAAGSAGKPWNQYLDKD